MRGGPGPLRREIETDFSDRRDTMLFDPAAGQVHAMTSGSIAPTIASEARWSGAPIS